MALGFDLDRVAWLADCRVGNYPANCDMCGREMNAVWIFVKFKDGSWANVVLCRDCTHVIARKLKARCELCKHWEGGPWKGDIDGYTAPCRKSGGMHTCWWEGCDEFEPK